MSGYITDVAFVSDFLSITLRPVGAVLVKYPNPMMLCSKVQSYKMEVK